MMWSSAWEVQSPSPVSVEYELRCARKFEITGDISVPAAAAEATVLELTTGLRENSQCSDNDSTRAFSLLKSQL